MKIGGTVQKLQEGTDISKTNDENLKEKISEENESKITIGGIVQTLQGGTL